MSKSKPIPITNFLAGGHLKRGDVVLTSPLGKFSASLIRWAIRSEFSHASMMFLVPNPMFGFDEHYLIESGTSGVDIVRLSDYYGLQKTTNLIGIKRLEAPWFNEKLRSMASGRMLRFIKEDYDFSRAGVIGTNLNRLVFKASNALFGTPPSLRSYAEYVTKKITADRHHLPAEFICSGFVQYAYYDVATMLLRLRNDLQQETLNPEQTVEEMAENLNDLQVIEDVLFADWMDANSSIKSLLAVTPEDLARTNNLSWKFIIFKDLVYPVSSHEEAYEIIHKLV